MVENVQCPVCTLFLHAGMSLSDHLETHPKEQVIKALVQLTMTGGSSAADGVLKAALLGSSEPDKSEKPEPNKTEIVEANKCENDVSRSNSRMSTISNASVATTSSVSASSSTNSSLSFTNSLVTTNESIQPARADAVVVLENVCTEEVNRKSNSKQQSYQYRSNHAAAAGASEATTISEAFNAMHFSRFQQQQQQQPPPPSNPNQSQFKIVHQKPQTTAPSKQSNFSNVMSQQQQQLPPPPPPIPVQQQQSKLQSVSLEMSAAPFSTSMLQSVTYGVAANQRQQQQQQQQSAKIIYSGGANLPPPPPLQLFSYQHSSQQYQHQKPPPAYGAAISQIRSQQNQNKQNIMQASSHTFPHKTQSLAHGQQQQQQQLQTQQHALHRHMAPINPPRIVSHVASHQLNTMTAASSPSSTFSASTSSAHSSAGSKQSEHLQAAEKTRTSETLQKLQPPPPPPLMQATSAASATQKPLNGSGANYSPIIAAAGSRQTNSPFSSLIAAQSPSSVLRFAESPVAHYLERDNGDFIVQETPKHIVECVEEEDGEFSVIERFHQSPPSVLHIHDDDEDEDDNVSEVSHRSEDLSKKEAAPSAKNKNKSQRSEKQAAKEENASTSSSGLCTKAKSTTESCNSSGANSVAGSNSNTLDATIKKTSKNTITVLSDVQLNLNEYLDLMGNIIASGKIAKRRTTCSASAPIPLVKVEKIEPEDPEDYEMTNANEPTSEEFTFNEDNMSPKSASPLLQPKANANETERRQQSALDDTPSCSTSPAAKWKETDESKPPAEGNMKNSSLPAPPIHLTSVIRMASTATPRTINQPRVSTPPQQQQQTNDETAHQAKETKDENSHQTKQQQPDLTNVAADEQSKPSSSSSLESAALTPQDLSQPQKTKEDEKTSQAAFACGLPPPPPLRKGPKKLVIKPKSIKTEENAKKSDPIEKKPTISTHQATDGPSTSRAADQLCQTVPDVVIKCEPGSYEMSCSSSSNDNVQTRGILEQHLKSSTKFFQNEHPHQYQTDNMDVAVDYSAIKSECEPNKCESFSSFSANASKDSAAAADARVLLDFANSTKRAINGMEYENSTHVTANVAAASTSFFSPNSLFSNALQKGSGGQRLETNSTSGSLDSCASSSSLQNRKALHEQEFIAVEDLISVSCSQSAAINAAHAHHQHHEQDQQEHTHQHHHQQHQISQSHNSFSDYQFNFFYNGAQNAESSSKLAVHQQAHSFSPNMYHQTPDATTTAATVASSSTLDTLEDSTSTPADTNRFGSMHNTIPQWYQPATLVAHSDFSAALSIDNAAVDGDVGKYLDLDACKREEVASTSASALQIAPSSTSSSFAADSSLAGGCTTDTLNIRTDEKMPPKGEISEQESNCDIENSWSQPVYGEIPSKFYRTTFPGIFPHDGGWNQDEYFTVQDLSPTGNSAPIIVAANGSSKAVKSFEFHLPMENAGTSFASTVVSLSNDDVFPSTSMGAAKKKKKRDSENGAHRKSKPTSTITSQQFAQSNGENAAQSSYEQAPTSTASQRHQKPSTSTAAAARAAATTTAAAAAANNLPARVRRKVYVCPHCNMEFKMLRDKNHHMIEVHNYVRQNRRLISLQSSSSIAPDMVNVVVNEAAAFIPALTEAQPIYESTSAAATGGSSNVVDDFLGDSKHNIKIKQEYDQPSSASAMSQPLPGITDGIHPKVEYVDEKANVLGTDGYGNITESAAASSTDTKPPPLLQPLPLATAPTTKLATLYRMLISFNVSTLKQSQNLTESEEKLIESSIFFCYTCRTNFTSVKLYDAHLTEHPAECFTCGKKFQRWKNFSLHLKRHLGWKEFGCNVCDKKFVVRSALVEHTRMHTGHTPLKCKVCGKSFKRYSNLTQHRKRHGRVVVRKKEYVCHCGEVLPSKARFLWHKETHDSKPKCCPHCCDRFVHANSLRRHIRLAHSDKFDYAEPMECPMCKQVFAKSSIKAHMATHSMDTQHDCNICNKSFSTKWNLKIHLWVHANRTAKPFKCEHCPKAFVREVDFKNHMNAHKQIKPYTCEYCGCKFIRKYNYMRHRREHHGNKKFTCDLCKKSFHRHYYLIEHRRIHTGERPFQCTICGKSSTTKTNHNKHLRIHHSRDPFTVET